MASAPSDARAAEGGRGCGPSSDRLLRGQPPAATVADVMLRRPATCPADLTVGQAARLLRDDHVHALLVVDGDELVAVVERSDLVGRQHADPARAAGRLADRTVGPDADLEPVRVGLVHSGRRRLAVTGAGQQLLGLLCLKRTGLGFCTDDDVEARAAERAASVPPVGLEPTLRPF